MRLIIHHESPATRRPKAIERLVGHGPVQRLGRDLPHAFDVVRGAANGGRDAMPLATVGFANVLGEGALQEQPGGDGVVGVRVHHDGDRVRAGRLPAEHDPRRVAAEGPNVVAQPLEREALVAEPKVRGFIGRGGEAEDIEAVAVEGQVTFGGYGEEV